MNKKKRKLDYCWMVLFLMCIGIALPNYAQYQISAFGSDIMKNMNLTTTQFSTVATAPLIPGIFLSLISGLLVDKFGARKIITISIFITCLATILRVVISGFWSLYISMIFIGVCATFLNSNGPKILGQWFSPSAMTGAMGIFLAMANIGISLGNGTASLYSGMKGAFIGSAVIAVITLVLWLVFMREKPAEAAETQEEKVSVLEGLKFVAKSKTVWIVAVTLFLCAGCITSMSNFLPAALVERGFTDASARTVTMGLTLGSLLGCFVCPLFFKYLKKQRLYFIAAGIIAVLGVLFAWRVTDSVVITFIFMFITGFCCNGVSPVITAMPVQDPSIGTKLGGTAGGLVATIQLGASVIIPSYVIAPISQQADGSTNFVVMFSLFALMMVLFVIMTMFLPLPKRESK